MSVINAKQDPLLMQHRKIALFKYYQNLNITNFLDPYLKNKSIDLKKLGIKNTTNNVDEIGQTSFQQNRVNNWKINAKLMHEIYKDYCLYKLAKNFNKWSPIKVINYST